MFRYLLPLCIVMACAPQSGLPIQSSPAPNDSTSGGNSGNTSSLDSFISKIEKKEFAKNDQGNNFSLFVGCTSILRDREWYQFWIVDSNICNDNFVRSVNNQMINYSQGAISANPLIADDLLGTQVRSEDDIKKFLLTVVKNSSILAIYHCPYVNENAYAFTVGSSNTDEETFYISLNFPIHLNPLARDRYIRKDKKIERKYYFINGLALNINACSKIK